MDTRDHEDHTFCGIMFDICVKTNLPIEYIEINSLWIRGCLGEISVFVTAGGHEGKYDKSDGWSRIYQQFHQPSEDTLIPLEFKQSVVIPAGERIGVYIHSTRDDDQAIVYDNQRGQITMQDNYIQVEAGLAHISNEAFHSVGHWGGWAWRPNREFVGRVSHGVRYFLWKPSTTVHEAFPRAFRASALTLLLCQRRTESPISVLSDDIILYILNLCGWNWFGGLDEKESQHALPENDRDSDEEGGFSWGSRNYFRAVAVHELAARGRLQGMQNLPSLELILSRWTEYESEEEGEDEDDDSDYVPPEGEEEDIEDSDPMDESMQDEVEEIVEVQEGLEIKTDLLTTSTIEVDDNFGMPPPSAYKQLSTEEIGKEEEEANNEGIEQQQEIVQIGDYEGREDMDTADSRRNSTAGGTE